MDDTEGKDRKEFKQISRDNSLKVRGLGKNACSISEWKFKF